MNEARSEPTHDPLKDKIERLLVRHEESRRTVALLETQVKNLTQERDGLQARLQSASLRMAAVLDQLPATPAAPIASTAPTAL